MQPMIRGTVPADEVLLTTKKDFYKNKSFDDSVVAARSHCLLESTKRCCRRCSVAAAHSGVTEGWPLLMGGKDWPHCDRLHTLSCWLEHARQSQICYHSFQCPCTRSGYCLYRILKSSQLFHSI
jgi:hypothetical protein